MANIQYQIHKILNSEYKLLIAIFIYFIIYFSVNTSKIVYCMTENTDIPEIAEAKESIKLSQQGIALRQNILDYADSQIQLLETVDQQTTIIDQQTTRITKQVRTIHELTSKRNYLEYRLAEAETKNIILKAKTSTLESSIRELKKNLDHTETLYNEAQSDKYRYHRLLRKALRKK